MYQQYANYQNTDYVLVHLVFNTEKCHDGTYFTERTLETLYREHNIFLKGVVSPHDFSRVPTTISTHVVMKSRKLIRGHKDAQFY